MPRYKIGDVVQNLRSDYSEKNFVTKRLPSMSVGRVKKIIFGGARGQLLYIKFWGHPLINFYADEVLKVRIPK